MNGWDDNGEEAPTPVSGDRTENPSLSDGETMVFPVDAGGMEGDANFDYAAFEAALDDISREEEQQAEAEAAQPVDTGPEERKTFPRRNNTDDATYAVRPVGRFHYVTIQGRINESFDGEALGAQIKGLPVIFELSEVDRITSFGVRGWLRLMSTAALTEAYFVRCSESVVNQITMIHNFCGPARVHSIMAPYLCGACGAEFGVVFDAVDDSALLRGRRPPEVKCPECDVAAEMDEDPWAFFDLDQQLLDEVPQDLRKVLDLLSVEPRHAPIEKTVTGTTTRVSFNGELSEKTRFHRALGGIEGKVVLDLTHLESATPAGLQKLLFSLSQVSDEVELFRVEGVTPGLAEMLREQRVPKLWVASLKWPATNANGIRRQAIVDVLSNRDALTAGRNPRVDAAWAQAGITLDDGTLARELVEEIGVHEAVAPTPAPVQRRAATPSPAHRATPAPAPGYNDPTVVMNTGGSVPGATPAPVAYVQAPPPRASNTTRYALAAAFVMSILAALVIVVAVAVIVTSQVASQPAPEPVAEAPPAPVPEPPTEAVRADGEWSTGGVAPPSWAASAVMQTDSQLFIVGSGSGADLSEASAAARRSALQQFASYVKLQLRRSPANKGLDAFPVPEDAAATVQALENSTVPLPLLNQAQAADRTYQGRNEVVAQFVADRTAVGSYIDAFDDVATFRGLSVAPPPPWSPSEQGTRLTETPSWWPVPLGSEVIEVDGVSVHDPGDFASTANGSYEALEPGNSFEINFQTPSGEEQTITVSKRETGPAPRPTLMKMDDNR